MDQQERDSRYLAARVEILEGQFLALVRYLTESRALPCAWGEDIIRRLVVGRRAQGNPSGESKALMGGEK